MHPGTLSQGRGVGIASGLGAASADAVYGLLVAAGFVATGILMNYAGPLAIAGGVLIAILGMMSIRSFLRNANSSDTPKDAAAPSGIYTAFATTFALTLSNPMTILAFVGLVAGLGASAASNPSAPYWLVLGVFLGSALWWLILVHGALAAKSRITPAVTRWFDLGSGVVLLVWGLWIAIGAL